MNGAIWCEALFAQNARPLFTCFFVQFCFNYFKNEMCSPIVSSITAIAYDFKNKSCHCIEEKREMKHQKALKKLWEMVAFTLLFRNSV